jgi:cysteinyl-tRNA synthetase
MGERRLRILEDQLPDDVFILGVDEHTGVAFDLESRQANVFGRGGMTVRRGTSEWVLASGESASFDEIAAHGGATRIAVTEPIALPVDARHVEELMSSGDVLAAVDALLNLDELDRDVETRATVHALITRLGHLAASPRVDLAEVVGPYIEALLQARQSARAGGRWDEADLIRDNLTSLRVVIKDSANGSSWEIDSA